METKKLYSIYEADTGQSILSLVEREDAEAFLLGKPSEKYDVIKTFFARQEEGEWKGPFDGVTEAVKAAL